MMQQSSTFPLDNNNAQTFGPGLQGSNPNQIQLVPTIPNGNLVVRPLTARLTHDTSGVFSKMSPLVKVSVGQHFQKTPSTKKGHKNPGWETELSMRRSNNEDLVVFEVWDRDILSSNDLIGSGEFSFVNLMSLGNRFNGWVPLRHKGKSAGELLVDLIFIPDSTQTSQRRSSSVKRNSTFTISPMVSGIEKAQTLQTTFDQDSQHVPIIMATHVRRSSTYNKPNVQNSPYSMPLQGQTRQSTQMTPMTQMTQMTQSTMRNPTEVSPINRVLPEETKETIPTVIPIISTNLGNNLDDQAQIERVPVNKSFTVSDRRDSLREIRNKSPFHNVNKSYDQRYMGDIITDYRDPTRYGKSQKIRTLEGERDRSMDLGSQYSVLGEGGVQPIHVEPKSGYDPNYRRNKTGCTFPDPQTF